MKVARLKTPPLVVTVGLLVGLIGDLLLYDKPLGISFPILIGVTLVALLSLAIVEKTNLTWVNLWLSIPMLYLAIMSAVRAAPFLRFLNIAGVLLLLALLADTLTTGPVTALDLGGYTTSLARTSLYSALIAPELLRRTATEVKASEESGIQARRILIGFLIAVPFLCVFTILFASADLLFNTYLEDILGDLTVGDMVGHAFLTAILAWVVMGGLAYALSRTTNETPAEPDGAPQEQNFHLRIKGALGIIEASIALYSIDVLFTIFVAIQFAALFGGEAFLERQGLTYSEYARQGFFQLLAVALITLGLILALDFITGRETPRQRLSFLLGSGLMIIMTIIILVSAFQRLRLYELAFGFTRLRVHAHVFMVWLAVLFAFFLVMLLARRTRLFATGVLIVSIGFATTLNILNPDAFIVRQNLQRYRSGEELDVNYIGSLSADAVPLLVPLLSDYGAEIRDDVGPWLRLHLDTLDRREERAGWPSTHVAINRATLALEKMRPKIETYDPANRYYFD